MSWFEPWMKRRSSESAEVDKPIDAERESRRRFVRAVLGKSGCYLAGVMGFPAERCTLADAILKEAVAAERESRRTSAGRAVPLRLEEP